MTQVFHGSVGEIVPFNANYIFPQQATKVIKQTIKISPQAGSEYTEFKDIKIHFPSDGYLNGQNSTLNFDCEILLDGAQLAAYKTKIASASGVVTIAAATEFYNYYTNALVSLTRANDYLNKYILYVPEIGKICEITDTAVDGGTTVTTLTIPAWSDVAQGLADNAAIDVILLPNVVYQPGGGHQFFDRLTIRYGNQVLDDSNAYALGSRIMTTTGLGSVYEGSAGSILDGTHASVLDERNDQSVSHASHHISGRLQALLAASKPKRFTLKLFNEFLSNPKMIPLKYMAASLELQLRVIDSKICLVAPNGGNYKIKLSNVEFCGEFLELGELYDAAFLDGLSMSGVPLKWASWHHVSYPITSNVMNITISDRSRSIKNAFVVITDQVLNNIQKDSYDFYYDTDYKYDADNQKYISNVGATSRSATNNGQVKEFWWRIGQRYYPAQPVKCEHGAPEAYAELAKTLNSLGDYTFSSNITVFDWTNYYLEDRGRKFIMASEFENTDVHPNTISGLNGEEVSDMMFRVSFNNAAAQNKQIHILLQYDNLAILRPGNVLEHIQ